MPERNRRGGDPSMTDARYPDRWLMDRRINRLSYPAHHLFVTSMAWSVLNRTDGVIDADGLSDIRLADVSYARELVDAGLWEPQDDGKWLSTEYASSQTTKAQLDQLDKARLADRERKAKQRAQSSLDANSEDALKPAVRRTAQERTGKARPGQDDLPAPRKNEPTHDEPAPSSSAGVDSPRPDTGVWEDMPCDRCGRGPTRIASSGSRLCGGCGPVAWTTEPALGGQ